MRIPTLGQFQRQAAMISKQFDQMRILQEQIYSGKKIINASDDPVLASQLKSAEDYLNQLNSYSNNAILAKGQTELFEDSMRSAISATSDAQNIIQQVQNGTIKEGDRSNYAKALRGDLLNLLNAANRQNANGNYIFAGNNTDSPAYIQNGNNFQYQGGHDPTMIDMGLNVGVLFNESGFDVFGDIRLGNGTFMVTANSANTGTASTSAGSVINSTAYVPDTYTITFGTNSSNELVYQVVGATTGQVIPPLPATFPNGAPVYTPQPNGVDVTFKGMTLNISGVPKSGDTFVVKPSDTQNAFETIQNVINLLESPIGNRGTYDQAMRQAGSSVQQIFSHFVTYQSAVGTRSASIDGQISTNKLVLANQTMVIGELQDADMTEVFSKLAQQSLALQATQAGYLKIQETFTNLLKI